MRAELDLRRVCRLEGGILEVVLELVGHRAEQGVIFQGFVPVSLRIGTS